MFTHWFTYVMAATFVGAVITMLLGVAGLGNATAEGHGRKSTRLMALRVSLCALLLLEITIWLTCIKP